MVDNNKGIKETLLEYVAYAEDQFQKINKQHERLENNQGEIKYQIKGLRATVDKLDRSKEDSVHVDELEDRVDGIEDDVEKLKKAVYH